MKSGARCSKKYSPDSFKLTPEEEKALSDKLSNWRKNSRPITSKCGISWSASRASTRSNMDEMQRRMQEAYQRYQELRNRLQNQISDRSMQQRAKT